MNTRKSIELFKRAENCIPGGVNSPVRAFKSVGTNPLFIKKAEGSYIYDEDNNKYIDYVCSWGPMILGHNHPRVIQAVKNALNYGTSFGAPTRNEIKLAELIQNSYKSIDKVRLVNSGTEAAMSAVRLARAFTGKNKIIKFEGCYHGHADSFLIKAGSGAMTFGHPSSPGVTKNTAADTLMAKYNDIDSVQSLFKKYDNIAAVIIEPIPANMGVVLPENEFLTDLADLIRQEKALLIFDEIITGFRVSPGGAQELYNIDPDITCLGKIIGGGFPIGAYGGKKGIMDYLAPDGPVYQAGTLSGNPVAVSAGLAALETIIREDVIHSVNNKGKRLSQGINSILDETGIQAVYNSIGSLGTLFFTNEKVSGYEAAAKCDTKKYAEFFKLMLDKNIYLAPSQFEAAFVSLAHSDDDIDNTLDKIRDTCKKVK